MTNQGGSVLFDGNYQGSSFYELLQVDFKHLLPNLSAWEKAAADLVPHGTTVLAMKYDEGVLVAGDRLATAGHSVASRDVVKVFSTDAHSVMAISGAAGPSIEMARILSVELEHYEKIEGESLVLEGKANKLSQMVRQNLPAAMQGLVVVPLFAGYDNRRKEGRLWKFDITGGRYEETEFDATGSGGLFARESLKHGWQTDLGRDAAVTLAVEALTAAADEDRATGGVDLERRIFPVVKLCGAAGIDEGSEEQIEQAYRAVLARRGNGGAAR
ncbi:MAG: proteasome subunit beta [Deltaproteobacteria bacterium]|nr:proteasome subunit beta [Deltaproteobacteria bacterium]